MNPTGESGISAGSRHNVCWNHTMLRVKDPYRSVTFYEKFFGMRNFHVVHFEDKSFSSYFLESTMEGQTLKKCSSESEERLWTRADACLELVHNHGTENNDSYTICNGNVEPYRGFGHIAFNTNDVYAVCEELEKAGVKFQKRPDEGRMKGLAFALDPDGYWVEIISRGELVNIKEKFNLSQTMIRIKDPERSIKFYTEHMGMTLIRKRPMSDFTLYFLTSLPKDTTAPDSESEEAAEFLKSLWQPVLELTHNHGTENDPNFIYHNGNDDPQGYGHLGMIGDNLASLEAELDKAGVKFAKRLGEGFLKECTFVLDPDGYMVTLCPRGWKMKWFTPSN